ncbi:Hypothetical predicted protein [Olea europaea subsp. europaea]|nr:Hypothetical predicted protein [Olea europaea subsp. europaea]
MDNAHANISSNLEEKGDQNQVNEGTKSDSFVVDMQHFSRISRNLSNKGLLRGGEKKINPFKGNEREARRVSTSPTALHGSITPEKPVVVMVGATDHSINTQGHHQITIMNGSMSNRATERKFGGKRLGFRRSSPFWTVDPRRILFFFATLSSVGTILLIYFTLSIRKLEGNDNALD